jgi:hypothetical protein
MLTPLIYSLFNICSINVLTKIYKCGDRVKEDVNFTPCFNLGSSTYFSRKENSLGLSKVKGKCKQSNYTNP